MYSALRIRETARSIARQANKLGSLLVERGIELVYGGGNIGLMGVLADRVLTRGGRAIGVIPESLMAKEIGHTGLTKLPIVNSMHEQGADVRSLRRLHFALIVEALRFLLTVNTP